MNRFIVLEGNNASGKSTAGRFLERRLPSALFHYPAGFSEFRQAIGMDERVRPLPNLIYHLAATLHLSDLVRERLEDGHVVCDRYLAGPISLLLALGAMDEAEIDERIAPHTGELVTPERTVLLTVSHEVACTRIRERRAAGSMLRPVERRILDSREFFVRREQALRSFSARLGPVSEIDTTGLSTNELYDRVLRCAGTTLEWQGGRR